MGSNHLRRNYLQKEDEQPVEAEEFAPSKRPTASKFALLSEETDEPAPTATSSTATRPAKRQKRKPKKQKQAKEEVDEDALLEEAIRSVQLDKEKSGGGQAASDQSESCLKVDTRQLDPDQELNQLIGKNMEMRGARKVVKQERNARTFGKTIKMKNTWPPFRNYGFELEKTKTVDGITWFRAQHSESYRSQQYMFCALRRNLDYETIIEMILSENAYHLESLLLLTQYYAMQEDTNQANDSIERALFAVESSSFKFNLLLPEHRLEYNWRDNRVIFNLLWQRVQVLANKNCFSTALQYAKILFAKDQEDDPLAVSLLFDVLALKGGNFQFLVQFFEEFNEKRNLEMLPNILYSTAYAYARLFEHSHKEEHLLKSNELIKKAFTRFPFVLTEILESLNVDSQRSLQKATIFRNYPLERETAGIQLLIKIFFKHTLEFWKEERQAEWLETTSTSFVRDFDSKIKAEAKEWKERRSKVFVGIPLNVKRHALLCGLPMEEGDQFDPFPPANSEAAYWPEKKLDEEIRQLAADPHAAAPTGGTSLLDVLGSLMRTLVPQASSSVPEQGAAERAGANDDAEWEVEADAQEVNFLPAAEPTEREQRAQIHAQRPEGGEINPTDISGGEVANADGPRGETSGRRPTDDEEAGGAEKSAATVRGPAASSSATCPPEDAPSSSSRAPPS